MERWRRWFLIGSGFVEALFFSGCLFGWPSLLLILQKEGVYTHVCTDLDNLTGGSNFSSSFAQESHMMEQTDCLGQMCNNSEIANLSYVSHFSDMPITCNKQAIEMTLVYTFAAVIYGIAAIFIGLCLDHFGIRITRVIGSVMGCTGFIFLAFTSSKEWYFLWPALNLIAMGSNQLRLSGFQFAEYKPDLRSTILIAYSSAYSISTALFIAVQLLYEYGIPMKTIFLCCAALCSMTFIPTLLIRKEDSGENQSSNKDDKSRNGDTISRSNSYEIESLSPQLDIPLASLKSNNNEDEDEIGAVLDAESGSSVQLEKSQYKRVMKSITSLSGVLHAYWHFINLFLILFYSSTFNLWASRVNSERISFYIKMSGVCSLFGPICIPISGLITDWIIRRAKERNNELERIGYTMQAPTFAMFGATTTLLLTIGCKLFDSEIAIYLSLILMALSRPAVVGTCMSYIRLRFPADQFNILNGLFTTFISLLCFVQYPVMRWLVASDESYIQVHIFLLALLTISLVSPVHMMFRKNAMKYARDRWMDDLRGTQCLNA